MQLTKVENDYFITSNKKKKTNTPLLIQIMPNYAALPIIRPPTERRSTLEKLLSSNGFNSDSLNQNSLTD